MKLLIAIFVFAALPWTLSAAEPVSEAVLKDIIQEVHSPELVVPELKVYPKAREYSIKLISTSPAGVSQEMTMTCLEKWVRGRYIVSETLHPAGKSSYFMVVDYDADTKLYRKYLLLDGRQTGYQVGIRVGESRTITWLDQSAEMIAAQMNSFGAESHTDTSSEWDVRFFLKGVLQGSQKGVAKVVK